MTTHRAEYPCDNNYSPHEGLQKRYPTQTKITRQNIVTLEENEKPLNLNLKTRQKMTTINTKIKRLGKSRSGNCRCSGTCECNCGNATPSYLFRLIGLTSFDIIVECVWEAYSSKCLNEGMVACGYVVAICSPIQPKLIPTLDQSQICDLRHRTSRVYRALSTDNIEPATSKYWA